MLNHNHGAYLRGSLGATLAQTRAADEIIVIDDASTDGSIPILEEIAAQNPTIRLIRNKQRIGVVPNLNKGLREARGDYISFPAADDLIFPDFLAETSSLLDRHPDAAFAAACADIWDNRNVVIGHRPVIWPTAKAAYVGPEQFRALISGADNFFLGAVTLYRRAALNELGGFDPELGSMSDGFVARRMAARHGFCFIPKALGVWRVHGENYSVVMATSERELDRMIARSVEILQKEPAGLFPARYPKLLSRRLHFGAGRLVALREDIARPEIQERLSRIAGGAALDRAAFGAAAWLGPLRTRAAIGWLALRLRPYSFFLLIERQIYQRLRRPRST